MTGQATCESVEPEPFRQLRDATMKLIHSMGRIYSRTELLTRRKEWKASGKTVVFTNGCYDLLHPGHMRLLDKPSRSATY